jgi:hypothetical protein
VTAEEAKARLNGGAYPHAANGARCRQNGTPRAMRRRAESQSVRAQQGSGARVQECKSAAVWLCRHSGLGCTAGGGRCMRDQQLELSWSTKACMVVLVHGAKALAWASDRPLHSHASRIALRHRAPASPDCEQECGDRPRRYGASRVQLPARPHCLQRVGGPAGCLSVCRALSGAWVIHLLSPEP